MVDTARSHDAGRVRARADLQPRGPQVQHARSGDRTVAGTVLDGWRAATPAPSRSARSARSSAPPSASTDEDLAINGPLLAPGVGAQGGPPRRAPRSSAPAAQRAAELRPRDPRRRPRPRPRCATPPAGPTTPSWPSPPDAATRPWSSRAPCWSRATACSAARGRRTRGLLRAGRRADSTSLSKGVAEGGPGAFLDVLPTLQGLAKKAPSDLKDEWQTLLNALTGARRTPGRHRGRARRHPGRKLPAGLSPGGPEAGPQRGVGADHPRGRAPRPRASSSTHWTSASSR